MKASFFLVVWAALAASCATTGDAQPSPSRSKELLKASSAVQPVLSIETPTTLAADRANVDGSGSAPPKPAKLYPGNDRMVKPDLGSGLDPVLLSGERVTLNFENVPLGNLVHALLGDLLQLNYTIDAGADVVVSLRTRQPLLRAQVLDVLDAVLVPHDLAILRDNAGVYHLTKRNATLGARPVVSSTRLRDLPGAGTVIATLNYVSAVEMAKILMPVAPKEAIVHVDTLRNLLVLQGSKSQLTGWLDLIDAFDVDYLAGMSLGIFVLEHANVNEVRDALQSALSAEAPQLSSTFPAATAANGGTSPVQSPQTPGQSSLGALGGMLRLFPVERINALVVVTPRQHLLGKVETWIRRLDRPVEGLEPGLFVYPVQNGSAVHLAEMLNALYGSDVIKQGTGIAAGSAPSQFGRSTTSVPSASTQSSSNPSRPGTTTVSGMPVQVALSSASSTQTSVNNLEGNVRVVADVKRNAVLIRAPRPQYRRIEQALRELDKAPTQVLIEASIVEVSLTGNLSYGVEWYLQNSLSGGRTGQAQLNFRESGSIGSNQPGFSYTIVNKAGVIKAALNALAEKSQVRVLSNPSVLVLDNHNATIQIGRQQPIKSSTTIASTSVTTESITYKDTGVMLSVTPSVNAGGLITMDISQQVTDVGEIDAATGQRNFVSRQIQSRVAVRSGDPIVLGGLIKENETSGRSGIPGLADIPLLGALFSTNSQNSDRTELLVLLTPRALEDDDALRAASVEMRQRMRTLSLQPNFEKGDRNDETQ